MSLGNIEALEKEEEFIRIYILLSAISVDVADFLDVSVFIDATILFVSVYIIFLLGDTVKLSYPPLIVQHYSLSNYEAM